MKRYKILFLPFLLLFGAHCSDNKITSPSLISNPFPLRVGTYWEYQSENFTLHRRIVEVQKGPRNVKWYKLESSLFSQNDSSAHAKHITYLAFEEGQLREYEYENCTGIYNILIELPLTLGNSWLKYVSGSCMIGPCDTVEPGFIRCRAVDRIQIPDIDSIVARSDVSTPVSFFRDCVEIQETESSHEFKTAWLKPGVGFIKYEGFQTGRYLPISAGRVDFILTSFGLRLLPYPRQPT